MSGFEVLSLKKEGGGWVINILSIIGAILILNSNVGRISQNFKFGVSCYSGLLDVCSSPAVPNALVSPLEPT